MCELEMYTAVRACLQKLHRPTFNRVAVCYSEFSVEQLSSDDAELE